MRYLCLILFLLLCVACRPSDFELTMESYRAGDYDHAFKRFRALAEAGSLSSPQLILDQTFERPGAVAGVIGGKLLAGGGVVFLQIGEGGEQEGPVWVGVG